MSILQNMKIRTKILLLIFPMFIAGIAATGFMASRYKAADVEYSNFIKVDNNAAVVMARAVRNLTATAYGAYMIMVYDNKDPAFPATLDFYQQNKDDAIKRLESVKAMLPGEAQTIDGFIKRAQDIITVTDRAVEFGKQNRNAESAAELKKADVAILATAKDMADYNTGRLKYIADKDDALTDQTNTTILTSLAVIAGTYLLGILAAILVVSKGVTGPIERLRARMARLAGGEADAPVEGMDRRDEIGQMAKAVEVFRENAIERLRLERETEANRSLSERERAERERQKAQEAAEIEFAVSTLAAALSHLSDGDVSHRISQPFGAALDGVRRDFNASAEKLQGALNRVASNARGIDAGANEIRAAADSLAKRTEQQAAAVEETAAALEEITTTVKDSTRRAQEAGQLVAHTRTGAEKSGEVVRKAVVAMERIEKSSGEIGNIIGVIDEIAFQTNLLALNAGVEAARAGDAGKGFAVVAQEVRELAQRSAKAAKEIKALILASNEQVQEGVKLVGDTGKALASIVTEVQEINQHVMAIVEAAQEQSSGLQQINTAVNQMDQDTQKNAAMVEETTASTHGLASEVTSLNQLLGQFRLDEAGSPQAAASRPSGRTEPAARQTAPASSPAPSPARALGRKLASAFSGNAAVETTNEWQEF